MAPAATRMTFRRSAEWSLRAQRCCRRAGSTTCRASSAAFPRACSTNRIRVAAQRNWPKRLRDRSPDRARLLEWREHRRGPHAAPCHRTCRRRAAPRHGAVRRSPAGITPGTPVLLTSSAHDPIITPENAARLKQMLENAGALVEHRILPAGHELSQTDVTLAREFMREN